MKTIRFSEKVILIIGLALIFFPLSVFAQQSGYAQSRQNYQQQTDSSQNWNQSGQIQGQGIPSASNDRIEGVIVTMDALDVSGAQQKHILARIGTGQGLARVDLGPQGRLSQLNLQQGDRIEAIGTEGTINRLPVLVAHRLISNGRTYDIDRTTAASGGQGWERSFARQTTGQDLYQGHKDVSEDAAQTIDRSTELINDFLSRAGKDIPSGIIQNSAGVAAIPGLTRIAFIAAGRHGTGVLLTHDQNQWSLPVFASITGGSVGAQIGVSSTDVLLVFRNQEAISRLRNQDSLQFGIDLTVAAGPVGGTADWSSTDADVLAYKRTGGLYAGLGISAGNFSTNPGMTLAYYTEPSQQSMRGYYDQGQKLVSDLLSLDRRVRVQKIPRGALQLKQTMDRISG